jgi:hypothetical protein
MFKTKNLWACVSAQNKKPLNNSVTTLSLVLVCDCLRCFVILPVLMSNFQCWCVTFSVDVWFSVLMCDWNVDVRLPVLTCDFYILMCDCECVLMCDLNTRCVCELCARVLCACSLPNQAHPSSSSKPDLPEYQSQGLTASPTVAISMLKFRLIHCHNLRPQEKILQL